MQARPLRLDEYTGRVLTLLAVVLVAVVLVAAPLAVHVPLAAMAGILLFVAYNMGEWHQFARLRQFSLQYRTVLIGTFLLTVIFDLTVAIEVGLVLACVFFTAWCRSTPAGSTPCSNCSAR